MAVSLSDSDSADYGGDVEQPLADTAPEVLNRLQNEACSDPCVKTLRAFLAACPRTSDTAGESAMDSPSYWWSLADCERVMQLLGFSIPVISEEALESDPLDPESFRGKWLSGNISCAVICGRSQHGLDMYNPHHDTGVAKALQQLDLRDDDDSSTAQVVRTALGRRCTLLPRNVTQGDCLVNAVARTICVMQAIKQQQRPPLRSRTPIRPSTCRPSTCPPSTVTTAVRSLPWNNVPSLHVRKDLPWKDIPSLHAPVNNRDHDADTKCARVTALRAMQAACLPQGEHLALQGLVTYASVYHGTNDKISAGPRMLLQLSDNVTTLTIKVFNMSDENVARMVEGAAVQVTVHRNCRVTSVHPRATEPLVLRLDESDKALYVADFELLFDDSGNGGRPMPSVKLLEDAQRYTFPSFPCVTNIAELPSTVQGTWVVNVMATLIEVDEIRQKNEPRRQIRLKDDTAELDACLWCGHARLTLQIGHTYLLRYMEISSNRRGRAANLWWWGKVIALT